MQDIIVFAVGVGSEITTSELVSIANRPSSTYVLYAEDYTTIDRIRDSMEQKLCEGQNAYFVCLFGFFIRRSLYFLAICYFIFSLINNVKVT